MRMSPPDPVLIDEFGVTVTPFAPANVMALGPLKPVDTLPVVRVPPVPTTMFPAELVLSVPARFMDVLLPPKVFMFMLPVPVEMLVLASWLICPGAAPSTVDTLMAPLEVVKLPT